MAVYLQHHLVSQCVVYNGGGRGEGTQARRDEDEDEDGRRASTHHTLQDRRQAYVPEEDLNNVMCLCVSVIRLYKMVPFPPPPSPISVPPTTNVNKTKNSRPKVRSFGKSFARLFVCVRVGERERQTHIDETIPENTKKKMKKKNYVDQIQTPRRGTHGRYGNMRVYMVLTRTHTVLR